MCRHSDDLKQYQNNVEDQRREIEEMALNLDSVIAPTHAYLLKEILKLCGRESFAELMP